MTSIRSSDSESPDTVQSPFSTVHQVLPDTPPHPPTRNAVSDLQYERITSGLLISPRSTDEANFDLIEPVSPILQHFDDMDSVSTDDSDPCSRERFSNSDDGGTFYTASDDLHTHILATPINPSDTHAHNDAVTNADIHAKDIHASNNADIHAKEFDDSIDADIHAKDIHASIDASIHASIDAKDIHAKDIHAKDIHAKDIHAEEFDASIDASIHTKDIHAEEFDASIDDNIHAKDIHASIDSDIHAKEFDAKDIHAKDIHASIDAHIHANTDDTHHPKQSVPFMVIGVAGRAGSGKDTLSDRLLDHFQGNKSAFAGPLF